MPDIPTYYSIRDAWMGASRDACQAGIAHAKAATNESIKATPQIRSSPAAVPHIASCGPVARRRRRPPALGRDQSRPLCPHRSVSELAIMRLLRKAVTSQLANNSRDRFAGLYVKELRTFRTTLDFELTFQE
jgi:hypothetical protein